jgi:hypothetical protein
MAFFEILQIPDNLNRERMVEALGKNSFAVLYDLNLNRTLLWLREDKSDLSLSLAASIPGFQAELGAIPIQISGKKLRVLSFYRNEEEDTDTLHDLFAQKKGAGFVSIAFINADGKEAERAKLYAEALLSSKGMRETRSTSNWPNSLVGSSSIHRELYKDSEELIMAKGILSSINDSALKNNLFYKPFLIFEADNPELETYLKSRFTILSESIIGAEDFSHIMGKLSKAKAFPYGSRYCSQFMRIYMARKARIIESELSTRANSGVPMGKLMVGGVSESTTDICIDPQTLNLGFLINGLPGSGKTMEAMHIVDRIINSSKRPSFVIAPSEEWDGFAISHGMNLIRLFSDELQINFFRCPPTAEKERFYQDLATVLASATGAGPFRRPMEKCLLNAFRRAYQNASDPDPINVYLQIEESIISLHGKRTNAGIKYTKHGENIRAALENLRIILNNSNYSRKEGIKFEEFLTGGAVFDMSACSTATRSFLYALILNQIYAITSNFDTKGDEDLRMLICVEEAQIIFKEESSPAVEDLKQRIQDFRKRGIGLMLMAHNVNDIDLGIRRLCQTRLYMKQAADSAYLAAKELIFPDAEPDQVVEKLKLLDSRIGALNFIVRKSKEKIQGESIFIKTETFEIQPTNFGKRTQTSNNEINSEIRITFADGFENSNSTINVRYLNEPVSQFEASSQVKTKLVKDRIYIFSLINEKGRVVSETKITAKQMISLFLDKNKILEIV